MDAVILAAGRGERLRDLTPRFHKPLLPIDGVPLVCRAVDVASEVADRVVVVVAPANAEAISGALGQREVSLIIQRYPLGPGHALLTGLSLCQDERVLVLLSDNVVTLNDVKRVTSLSSTGVGVKYMPRREAHRFTRYVDNLWQERVPLSPYGDDVACWVGPFVGLRGKMWTTLKHVVANTLSEGDDEILIGPHLEDFMGDDYRQVPVDSYDVGTLESYPKGGTTK